MLAQERQRILVVDDEPFVLDALEDFLEDDFDVVTESDPAAALEIIRSGDSFAVIISDQRMPKLPGDEFLEAAREFSDATRVLLTGHADIGAVIRAVNNGRVYGYVSKPWDPPGFKFLIYKAVERFELQQAMHRERELLHNLMDNSPDAIFFKDTESRYLRINRAYARLLELDDPGATDGELAANFGGALVSDVSNEEEKRILVSGDPQIDKIEKIITADGEERWLSVTKAPIRNKQGEIHRLVGIARDVTSRVIAERELGHREAALRHAEQLARIGHREWIPDGDRLDHWSPGLLSIAGLQWDSAPATMDKWLDLVHPADRDMVSQYYSEVAAEHALEQRLAYRILDPDKRTVYIEELLEVDAGGDADLNKKWFSTLRDVSEQRIQELELRLLLSVKRAASESGNFKITFQSVIEAICRTTGWDYAEVLLPDENGDDDMMLYQDVWYSVHSGGRSFYEKSKSMRFRKGHGVVGTAWKSGELQWYPDLTELKDNEFIRRELADRCGMTGVVMVPVKRADSEKVLAVLGFGLFDGRRPDKRFADAIVGAAGQLGMGLARVETQRRLKTSEERFRRMADRIPGVIYRWVVHADGSEEMPYMSPKVKDYFGLDPRDIHAIADILPLIHDDDAERVAAYVRDAASLTQAHELRFRIRTGADKCKWMLVRAAPTTVANGDLVFDGVLLDVTDQVEAEDQARYLAEYDPSTGLPNRAHMMARLADWVDAAEKGESTVVLHIAIDQIKFILDSFGHERVHEVQAALGRRLQHDAAKSGLLARVDSTDLVLVLPKIAQGMNFDDYLRGLRAHILKPVIIDGVETQLTASIGVALAPQDGRNNEQLTKAAAVASERARLDGGDRHCFHSAEMAERVQRKFSLATKLRKAVGDGMFEVHYQPIVHAMTGAIQSVEALVRWPQEGGGFISPADFIPLAEEIGLIIPLGNWVLRDAMSQVLDLRERGLFTGRVHINLSSRQYVDDRLLDDLRAAVDETGFPAAGIELELTESGMMGQVDSAFGRLRAVREMGFSTAIDDFGTGYSSLSYLRNLPVDTLKIDRSFVQKMTTDSKSAAVVNSIVDLGHGLGMSVVAEGVESEQELNFLRAYRCDLIQGYYFHKPMPFAEFQDLLKKNVQGE